MSKIFIFKHIALIAITLILAVVVAGCVGTRGRRSRSWIFQLKQPPGLTITNKGGDTIALKDEKITVIREVNG